MTGAPFIRFYAAAPLVLRGGERVGTLCVIAREPRTKFEDRDRRALDTLARQVVSFFENRRSLQEQKIAQLIGETATDAFVASNAARDSGSRWWPRSWKPTPGLPTLLITALTDANRLRARCADLFNVIGSTLAPPRSLVGMVREALIRAQAKTIP